MQSITGNLVDVHRKKIYAATVFFDNGKIVKITPAGIPAGQQLHFILPGFIDAHVHIESSMLVPAEFARLAVVHGTVATVSDPHEIANVCGLEGVNYMIENGKTVPFKFFFGAPSCVPATTFETAGAELNADAVNTLLQREEIKYLSEVMNFPGVINGDHAVLKKLAAAKKWNKPIDGHAPGLRGADLKKYISAGITTDHECFTADEALEKLQNGMKVIIREGSAAKNFDALIDLLHDYPDKMMFCSDDKHPDSLVEGHINQLCARAAATGIDLFNIIQAACVNPVLHYGLDVGLLRAGDAADFIVVSDLKTFDVLQTYSNGELVAENGKSKIRSRKPEIINRFNCSEKEIAAFETAWAFEKDIPVIEAIDGQLITAKLFQKPIVINGKMCGDVANDVLKIVVVNRYKNAPVAKAFITAFGLKRGAIASSVAHDSHNIIAVGADDESICKAVNLIIKNRGGISVVWPIPDPSQRKGPPAAQPSPGNEAAQIQDVSQSRVLCGWDALPSGGFGWAVLPLPVAGLMSTEDGYEVAAQYAAINNAAKELGSKLKAPFMTLSFMALLVIPHLKLSDKGLFDGDAFALL